MGPAENDIKVKVPGHQYEIRTEEGVFVPLNFLKKIPVDGGNELEVDLDGITNEQVLRVLIDRMYFLNKAFPCRENSIVITNLEESLMWLNERTQKRIARGVEGTHQA